MEKNLHPLLSLCIPIYNRLPYLERMLARFLEDKELFEDKIELIISDNCSEDDLTSCVRKFQAQGLNLVYHRQTTNVGADGNFKTLFNMASGKYCWLLGSDDIPVRGFLPALISALRDTDYGLFHIKSYHVSKNGEITIYSNNSQNQMLEALSYYITFMSANIFRTEIVSKVDLYKFDKTNLIQVPVYLESCFDFSDNAIFEYNFIEKGTDGANNGGYNLFKVFVNNLFSIFECYVNCGKLSKSSFKTIKKIEYKEFLLDYILGLTIIGKGKSHYKTDGSVTILFKHYGGCCYAYFYLIGALINYSASYFYRKVWQRTSYLS